MMGTVQATVIRGLVFDRYLKNCSWSYLFMICIWFDRPLSSTTFLRYFLFSCYEKKPQTVTLRQYSSSLCKLIYFTFQQIVNCNRYWLIAAGGAAHRRGSADAVGGTRAVRPPFPASGHVPRWHQHSPHVLVHAQTSGQAIPLPYRQPIPVFGPHAQHHYSVLAGNVPLSAVAITNDEQSERTTELIDLSRGALTAVLIACSWESCLRDGKGSVIVSGYTWRCCSRLLD